MKIVNRESSVVRCEKRKMNNENRESSVVRREKRKMKNEYPVAAAREPQCDELFIVSCES
jgi:hypothetical protein